MQILAWLAVVWPETFLILSIVCVYTFFCSFSYGALCPRPCQGSCAIEMSIIIIIIILITRGTEQPNALPLGQPGSLMFALLSFVYSFIWNRFQPGKEKKTFLCLTSCRSPNNKKSTYVRCLQPSLHNAHAHTCTHRHVPTLKLCLACHTQRFSWLSDITLQLIGSFGVLTSTSAPDDPNPLVLDIARLLLPSVFLSMGVSRVCGFYFRVIIH